MLIVITIISILILKLIAKYEPFTQKHTNQRYNVFVINLDRSTQRMASVKKQLDDEEVQFERFSAINGSNLKKSDLIENGTLENKKMDKGALGCSLSHMGVWKNVIRKDNMYRDHILVLEDDVIIEKNFKQKLNTLLDKKYDFDILYLGGSNIYGKKINNELVKPVLKNGKSTSNTGMYAMLIKKKILPYLLENNLPIKEYIDQNIKNNMFNSLNIYYVYPPIITHNNSIASDRRVTSSKKPLTKWFQIKQPKITIV